MPDTPAHTPADSLAKRAATILQAITAIGAVVALVLVVINARNQAQDNRHQLRLLQQQRYQSSYNSCQQTNQRHDRTVREFMVVFREQAKNPPAGFTKKDLRQNLDGNLQLIQAFEPSTVAGKGTLAQRERQGCQQHAFNSTHPKLSKQAKQQHVTH